MHQAVISLWMENKAGQGQRQSGNAFLSKVAFEQRPSGGREKLRNPQSGERVFRGEEPAKAES